METTNQTYTGQHLQGCVSCYRVVDTDTFKITVRYMDGKETIFPRATFDMLKFTIEEVVLPGLAIITRIEKVVS